MADIEEEKNLAHAAKRLIEHPDFQLVFKEIEADLFRDYRGIKLGDDEALKTNHLATQGFQLTLKKIRKFIEIGNLAEFNTEEESE